MDWEYSEPLNGALLAASKNTNSLTGLGSLGNLDSTFNKPSLYSNYYTNYDPLISRYKARASYFNRPTDPLLFDDLDDLTLEVEANSILSSRYRPSNQTRYVPSYYDLNKTSFNNNPNNLLDSDDNDFKIPQQPPVGLRNKNTNNLNLKPSNTNPKLAQQLQPRLANNQNNNGNQNQQSNNFNNNSPLVYQQKFQPIPFNQPASNHSNIIVNASNPNLQIQAHNSQQQRFLQYQQRILQQQQQQQPNNLNNNNEGMSELELLKLKQQQDRQQLLAAIANNQIGPKSNNNNNNINDSQNNNINLLRQYNKQYSETSIPSTNADPLNSNSPTPPMLSNRTFRNPFEKNTKNNNQQQNNNQKNKKNNNNSDDQNEQGSYLNTLRETRQREQRLAKDKYTSTDYKIYQKNYGFGRDFLPFEAETKRDKLEKARKREEYSKMIKERNTFLNENAHHGGKFTNQYANINNNVTNASINDPYAGNFTKRNAANNNGVVPKFNKLKP